MSSDTRWTRERIEAALEGAQLTGAVNRTYLTIIDDLLADRDLLLAERDQPASTYRLPDFLGGHEVRIVEHDLPGRFTAPHTLVAISGGEYDGMPLAVPSDHLVEVRPESIDDPVNLPFEIYDGANHTSAWLSSDDEGTFIRIYDHAAEAESRYVRPNVIHLRRLAQAAWQRANAVEHGPVSGPIGGRTEQARALDERNGVVAVQQPGTGAS